MFLFFQDYLLPAMFKTRHLFQSNNWYNHQIWPFALWTIIPDLSVWLTGLKMSQMEWQGIGFEGLGIFICICICICMEWQGIWIWGVGYLYLFVGDPFPSIFKHRLIFKTYFQFWSDFFQIPGTLVGKGTLPSRLQGIFNLIFFYFVSKYNVLFQGWTCLRSQG